MTFTPNIPATGQSLGSSRTQVLNNFTNYFNTVSQDHIAPNATGQGKHNKSTYPDQASDPVTIANEIAAYGKSVSGTSQLFLRPESAGNAIQMTRLDTGTSAGTAGWSFLPGGLIIQWGSCGIVNGSFTTTYTAHGGIAFPTTTLQVFLTVNDPSAPNTPVTSFTVNETLNNATSFTGTTNRAITLSYLAIGK